MIGALTSVNLIRAVCVCVGWREGGRARDVACVCVCVYFCVSVRSPFWLPAGIAVPLSMLCPSSAGPRLTN